MSRTPEFLAWAIAWNCPVRGMQDGSDPERTERQLRAARAYSDALREGCIFERLALDPPLAFRVDEALALYGGPGALVACCGDCPANAGKAVRPAALAGCYGIEPLPLDAAELHAQIDAHCDAPRTNPAWYGLWCESPLAGRRLNSVRCTISAALPRSELLAGIVAAEEAGLALHVRLYPSGRVEGPDWFLDSHCARCIAPASLRRGGACAVCGDTRPVRPVTKRKARGTRPYYHLARLVGAERAADILARYAASVGQQAQPGPARNPRPSTPADTQPDGSGS